MRPNPHQGAVPCQGEPPPGHTGRAKLAGRLRRHPAKAALARLEHAQCLTKLFLSELRPHRLREVELRVRTFPQHEVAEPLFATRANQQVDVSHRARIMIDFGEQLPEVLASERIVGATPRDLLRITLGGAENPIAGRIVDGYAKVKIAAARGERFR